MKLVKKNNLLIMAIICIILTISINLTYSKFTYSKEISGNVTTVAPLPSLYSVLAAKQSTLDTNVNFGEVPSSTNGQGLMMLNTSQNDEYPIIYYRGDVTDNNVIFVDLCWLIIRTTETGGVKLVYNGPTNSDGSCNNYSGVGGVTANSNYTNVFINNTEVKFNLSFDSPVYVGYMYNDNAYKYSRSTLTTGYVAHLADETVDQATGRHVQNLKDSNIKSIIDDWYEETIYKTGAENLLEDTVWCNDRSTISEIFTIGDYEKDLREWFHYAAKTRLDENRYFTGIITPSLSCARAIDKFTVDRANGNGDLTYSIGTLTGDEIVMAGNPSGVGNADGTAVHTYIGIPGRHWLLSPSTWGGLPTALPAAMVYYNGGVGDRTMDYAASVRPAISLNPNAQIKSGDGSYEKPYIIK